MADNVTREVRSRTMALVKAQDTTPEMTVRRLIHRIGYRFRLHVDSLPGKPDIVFPGLRKVIFVNGCFWHLHGCNRCRVPKTRRSYWIDKLSRNKTRDHRNRQKLRRAGWRVLTIWECELRHSEKLMNTIIEFLRRSPNESR